MANGNHVTLAVAVLAQGGRLTAQTPGKRGRPKVVSLLDHNSRSGLVFPRLGGGHEGRPYFDARARGPGQDPLARLVARALCPCASDSRCEQAAVLPPELFGR
jgi:hypothetical protein